MRYPASEKAEIIQLVEQSHLPAKRTLDKLGIPRATFYRWYDRYREGGPEALDDRRSRPDRVWNRIPDNVRRQIIDLALDLPELSPRDEAAGRRGHTPAGQARAQQLGEILSDFAGESANATAKALNERGLPSARGGKWTARSVINVRARLAG